MGLVIKVLVLLIVIISHVSVLYAGAIVDRCDLAY